MFRITLLPADQGDALWVEYGDGDGGTVHHILVDGGTSPTAPVVRERLDTIPPDDAGRRRLELFVVTHVDTDHIGGVLRLLSGTGATDLDVGDFWFNERRHLEPASALGAIDGEILGAFLDRLGWPSNARFQPADRPDADFPVMVPDPPADDRFKAPPSFSLAGGMTVTLLSPGPAQIVALREAWARELAKKHLDPAEPDFADKLSEKMHQKGVEPPSLLGDEDAMTVDELARQIFHEDPSPANGSSIAMLLEFRGRSILLAGDAVPGALLPGIARLARARRQLRLTVDAVKLPHHASANNVSAELIDAVSSPRWLISTNGSQHDHPDPQAVARVLRANAGRGIRLGFNYPKGTHPRADRWADPRTREQWGYEADYAPDALAGLTLELDDGVSA